MSESKGIRRDRLKVRFARPEGKISRRELLKLVVPRYEVVPFVEPALCRGDQECGLCLNSCPLRAITVEANEVAIDTALCSGCGACIVACPCRAIVYPDLSPEQLDKKMEGLVAAEGALPGPRIVVFVCQSCLPAPREDGEAGVDYPPDMLPLAVPCLAMGSPWLMLRAFDRGAQGLALVFRRGKCPVKLESNGWQGDIRFVQGLLDCWGVEPQRIKTFDVAEQDPGTAAEALRQFSQEIAGLGPTPLGKSGPTSVAEEGLLLPALIKGLADKLGSPSKGTVTAGAVPFGKLAVDGSKCTGCGLCARDCPTEALTAASGEERGYQLLFRHDLCVACGKCVAACYESCLQLEPVLELNRMAGPAVVLFADSLARCRQCGSIIGARAMIERVRDKLQTMGEPLISQLELCPACKMNPRLSLGDVTQEPANESG